MDKLNYDTIKNYQSFATINEMDQAVRGFLYQFKSTLSDGALKVLRFIWKYSVKVVGVSFAKYDTIAAGVSLSRRTVIRAVKMLEDLAFIKKIPTARMNGKQGVNLYVIQPFETIDSFLQPMSPQDVTVPVTPNKTENKQSSLCENKKQNRTIVKKANDFIHPVESSSCGTIKTSVEKKASVDMESSLKGNVILNGAGKQKVNLKTNVNLKTIEGNQLDSSFLPDYVNKDFIRVAQAYFNAEDIYKLWTRIHLAYRKVGLKTPLEEVMEPILSDFKQTVFMYKMGKINTTFEGYFYRVVYGRIWDLNKKACNHQWYEEVINRSYSHLF